MGMWTVRQARRIESLNKLYSVSGPLTRDLNFGPGTKRKTFAVFNEGSGVVPATDPTHDLPSFF